MEEEEETQVDYDFPIRHSYDQTPLKNINQLPYPTSMDLLQRSQTLLSLNLKWYVEIMTTYLMLKR